MTKENMAIQRKIVYMDESYIYNDNYCLHEESLYDPNYEQYLTTISHHKCHHYFFIADIFDADHSVPEFERTDAQNLGLLHYTLKIFEGGNKQTKDYHGMFNHSYFVGWVRKLMGALKKQNIENTIIIVDNAKYPQKLPDDAPRMGCKKETLLDKCNKQGIQACFLYRSILFLS